MKSLKPKYTLPFLRNISPDYIVDSVQDIYIAELPQRSEAIAFDADSTLVEHGESITSDSVLNFLKNLPLPVHIATNRIEQKATELASYLRADSVTFATSQYRKPQKAYFDKLASNAGRKPSELVMVGDRIFTDVYGANKAGLTTIYVKALGRDPWFIRYTGIRYIENALVALVSK